MSTSTGQVLNRYATKKRPKPMQIPNSSFHGIDSDRKVLYRNFHEISGVVYLVEISRNKTKTIILLFPNYEKPDIFTLQSISEKIFMKLMSDNGFQYD